MAGAHPGGAGGAAVFFDEEPALARLCVVEALAAGPRALEHRAKIVALLTPCGRRGPRGSAQGAAQPPPLTADGVVGAVLAVIHARLLEARSASR